LHPNYSFIKHQEILLQIEKIISIVGQLVPVFPKVKYKFGLDIINKLLFFGAETTLVFAILTYNLMALFSQFIQNSKVLGTLVIWAYFQKKNNKYILKLSLNMKRRGFFSGLRN